MAEEEILGSLNKTIAEKKKGKYDTALEKRIREILGNLLPEVCINGSLIFFFFTFHLLSRTP
jgi:hypothetical protein